VETLIEQMLDIEPSTMSLQQAICVAVNFCIWKRKHLEIEKLNKEDIGIFLSGESTKPADWLLAKPTITQIDDLHLNENTKARVLAILN